jgi:hypothetical protein
MNCRPITQPTTPTTRLTKSENSSQLTFIVAPQGYLSEQPFDQAIERFLVWICHLAYTMSILSPPILSARLHREEVEMPSRWNEMLVKTNRSLRQWVRRSNAEHGGEISFFRWIFGGMLARSVSAVAVGLVLVAGKWAEAAEEAEECCKSRGNTTTQR